MTILLVYLGGVLASAISTKQDQSYRDQSWGEASLAVLWPIGGLVLLYDEMERWWLNRPTFSVRDASSTNTASER